MKKSAVLCISVLFFCSVHAQDTKQFVPFWQDAFSDYSTPLFAEWSDPSFNSAPFMNYLIAVSPDSITFYDHIPNWPGKDSGSAPLAFDTTGSWSLLAAHYQHTGGWEYKSFGFYHAGYFAANQPALIIPGTELLKAFHSDSLYAPGNLVYSSRDITNLPGDKWCFISLHSYLVVWRAVDHSNPEEAYHGGAQLAYYFRRN